MTSARDGKCGAGDNRAAAMSEPRATLSGVDASNGGEAGIRTLRWRPGKSERGGRPDRTPEEILPLDGARPIDSTFGLFEQK